MQTPAPLHSGCVTSGTSFDLQQFPFSHIGCENDSSTCMVVVEVKWDYPSTNAMQVAWLIGNVLGMSTVVPTLRNGCVFMEQLT